MGDGKVWLVGAGPFDSGLFTLKGRDVLLRADVVVYDKLVGSEIISMIPESCEKINVGKTSGNHPIPQEEINEILLNEAKKGKRVVRLKGGDPFLFGRGGEELELLVEHEIPYEIVPGVTSALAVPAYAGIPVTHREYSSSLHIITAHPKRGSRQTIDYKKLVDLNGTLVFLMGVSELKNICSSLIEAGMNPNMPAAVIENGTAANQRQITGDLMTLPEHAENANLHSPAVIVVGTVCSLSEKFHWKDRRPLDGVSVLITRPQGRSSSLAAKLSDLGAEVHLLPLIEMIKLENNTELNSALQQIQTYHWLIFTSEHAVNVFFEALHENRIDIRKLGGIKFAAVGPMTQNAIEKRGVFVDYVPDKYYGEELGKGIAKLISETDKVMLLAPLEAKSDCAYQLSRHRIPYEEIALYETIYDLKTAEGIKNFEFHEDAYVAFTSASTVKGFVSAVRDFDFSNVQAVCIGERTAAEAKKYNMNIFVPDVVSTDAMVEQIVSLHGKKRK